MGGLWPRTQWTAEVLGLLDLLDVDPAAGADRAGRARQPLGGG